MRADLVVVPAADVEHLATVEVAADPAQVHAEGLAELELHRLLVLQAALDALLLVEGRGVVLDRCVGALHRVDVLAELIAVGDVLRRDRCRRECRHEEQRGPPRGAE
jgi:hypothetical protein